MVARNDALERACHGVTKMLIGRKKRTVLIRGLVPGAGIEPALLSETVFETVASTYSATRARCLKRGLSAEITARLLFQRAGCNATRFCHVLHLGVRCAPFAARWT